ncbi:DUF418 domain-containing protein [Actinokineospora auranticolor]|uniref:Putative membrane protein YeiB n=1 Tax=Actinokineospora auranticolor TaxID=155976 RepID=A0A2S6GPE1_9PSEU|nr:DUF418 domain-containing protein [Actinokineospora auranticolor]PPK67033.1 putative membrane protein YeiB [Actinokineospora auranticolor]
MSVDDSAPPLAPVSGSQRVLAPDLARGLMLALIALANSVYYLYGRPYGLRQHIVEHTMVDRVVSVIDVAFVDGRAYPMFAALFAYGVVQVFQRHRDAGMPERQAKRLLRRRSRWLLVFGFLHALLLFPGDVLGVYGLVGFGLVALSRASNRTLLVQAGIWLVLAALIQGAANMMPATGARSFFFSFETEDPVKALTSRPLEWLLTPVGMVGVAVAALLGTWAARRGALTDPANHRTLLRRSAFIGLPLAFLGGLPTALAVGHFWEPTGDLTLWTISALHTVTGIAGGLGYAALIGLAANRIGDRRGPVVRAISASGERSLSCYLFQSVVFVALLAPYTLGLGAKLGSAEVALVALGTWLVSVLLADQLRRAGTRGPAEVVLRTLVYRRKTPT